MTKRKKKTATVEIPEEGIVLVDTVDETNTSIQLEAGTDVVSKLYIKQLLETAPELRGDWDIQGAAYVENFRVKYAEFLAELTKLAS
jgi:hypothetical protein